MEEIKVTVRNVTGDFQKTTDVPLDMTFLDFREAAQEMAGLSDTGCHLSLVGYDGSKKQMNDNETFETANIKSGSIFELFPELQGG